jgi:acyl-coenzyme A synthetase/AMP-(fatty) acid ligase
VIARHRPTLFFSVPTGYAMLLAHSPLGQAGRVGQVSGSGQVGQVGQVDRVGHGGHQGHAARAAQAPEAVTVGAEPDLSSVRRAVSAGEALPPALFERFKERFGIEILDGIGSTETLHMFISNRPGAIRPGSSGQLIPGYDARILDDEKRPVAIGDIGNLYIKGDSICSAYWNQHEKSKDTIEGHWIRTGDKFHQDRDGFFWYAGRSDDMLKVGGQWVSPIEVENALVRHEAVQECAVIGMEDGDGLVKPCAFVVARAGIDATPDLSRALQAFVRSQLADYKRPRWIQFIAELPKTPTGKIQRFKLRESVARR